MRICEVCFTNESFITPCNCQLCIPCLINWFAVKNSEIPTFEFLCPNTSCHYSYTRQELQKFCNYPAYQLQLSEALLKEYLKNQDIKPCPNGKCKNYGFVDLHQRCDNQLQCPCCLIKWTDLSVATFSVQFDYGISNMFCNVKDFIYCFLFANECPQCGVQIQRKGGCQHMTCKACQHQFCWHCKQKWNGHKIQICGLQQFVYYGILSILTMSLLQTLGLFTHLFAFAMIPFQWFLFVITANVIPFGFVVGIVYFCYGWSQIYHSIYKVGILQTSISTLSLGLWYYVHNFIASQFELSFSMYISTVLWESFIAVVVVCYLFLKQLAWIIFPLCTLSLLYYCGLNGLCILMWGYPILKKRYANKKYYFQFGAFILFIILNIFDIQNAIYEYNILYIFICHILFTIVTNCAKLFRMSQLRNLLIF